MSEFACTLHALASSCSCVIYIRSNYYLVVLAWLYAYPGGGWTRCQIPIASRLSIRLCIILQSEITYVFILLTASGNRFGYWALLGIYGCSNVLNHEDFGLTGLALVNCFGQLMYYMVMYHFSVVLALYNAHSGDGMTPYGKVLFFRAWLIVNPISANIF